ncbi:hypothetical protein BS47DRAFT_1389136 [Hydnum rufescens UP504]|uniref:Uncharacterized protein n=1 Tax=Hydnum rufescens UP504 TaxID=1448309 RepID=A0A9P6E0S3_9AGAM|nr:hypothetical protein BS47DRAFT_1389136 [Hydnum rufescens UP504]
MTNLVNAGPQDTLAVDTGHHFISTATFPWKDSVNGPRVQDSEITLALQSKTLGRHKYVSIDGKIELNSHSHTTARRFKLDSFEIIVLALHGKSDSTHGLESHPIQCNDMSPVSGPEYAPSTEETRTSGLTLNPSPSSLRQIQFTSSTRRTHLGTSIVTNHQSALSSTSGTVWLQRVEDPSQRTFGGFLGTFSARFADCCSKHAGCSPDDPTSLSITIKATLSDTGRGASSKPLVQMISIHYPDWPTLDNTSYAGEIIHTTYDTDFCGPEVKVTRTIRDVSNTFELPEGITYGMEVYRTWGSGFVGHLTSSKILGAMNSIGKTLKSIGKQLRRPSGLLNMVYNRGAASTSKTSFDHNI